MNPQEPSRAGAFQVGMLCPACQVPLAEGDAFLSCPGCSAAHHAACWGKRGGCASYHCDARTTAAPEGGVDIRISADDVARGPTIVVAPSGRVPGAKSAPPRPTRISRGALAGLAMAGLAAASAGGIVLARGSVVEPAVALVAMGSLVMAFAGGVLSAISLATIFQERRARGAPIAFLALFLAVCAAGLDLWTVVFLGSPSRAAGGHTGLSLTAPEPPSPEMIANAPPSIANAMHANVFISGGSGLMSWCGAGIVLGVAPEGVAILTNRHVVDPNDSGGSGRLEVTFSSGEVTPGAIEWLAPDGVDLAVITARPSRAAEARTRFRRGAVQISERLFALGNPHALSWSYTEGAVSRVHRSPSPGGRMIEIVQTQTPLMSGNSGGGLYDAEGRLVGVNTWSSAPEDGQGPGFAISVATVAELVPERFLSILAAEVEEPGSGR